MVPFPCRLFVLIASLGVPRSKRSEWKREWNSELWHSAQSGATPQQMLRRAWGVFRDAAWFRETERKQHGFDLFRKALRIEASFLAFALLVALLSGALAPPRLPYANAERLVSLERNVPYFGSLDAFMSPKLPKLLKTSPMIEDVALLRVVRDPALGIRVSKNFFDVLGSKPYLGRTFREGDSANVVVLPYSVWQSRLNSDPHIVGRTAVLDGLPYTIVGIMPPDFWFRSPKLQFFAPFSSKTTTGGAIARLKPGVAVPAAQQDARRLAFKVEPNWFSNALELQPLLKDSRLSDLGYSLAVALIGAVLGMAFLTVKGIGPVRYRLILGARIWLAVMGLTLVRLSFNQPRSAAPLSMELVTLWLFLLLCTAVMCLLVIDHRERCFVCLNRLRKPVSIGSWASQILDQPATEYLCPNGHGTLYVAETGNALDHWTELDESWQELFAHTEE